VTDSPTPSSGWNTSTASQGPPSWPTVRCHGSVELASTTWANTSSYSPRESAGGNTEWIRFEASANRAPVTAKRLTDVNVWSMWACFFGSCAAGSMLATMCLTVIV